MFNILQSDNRRTYNHSNPRALRAFICLSESSSSTFCLGSLELPPTAVRAEATLWSRATLLLAPSPSPEDTELLLELELLEPDREIPGGSRTFDGSWGAFCLLTEIPQALSLSKVALLAGAGTSSSSLRSITSGFTAAEAAGLGAGGLNGLWAEG